MHMYTCNWHTKKSVRKYTRSTWGCYAAQSPAGQEFPLTHQLPSIQPFRSGFPTVMRYCIPGAKKWRPLPLSGWIEGNFIDLKSSLRRHGVVWIHPRSIYLLLSDHIAAHWWPGTTGKLPETVGHLELGPDHPHNWPSVVVSCSFHSNQL